MGKSLKCNRQLKDLNTKLFFGGRSYAQMTIISSLYRVNISDIFRLEQTRIFNFWVTGVNRYGSQDCCRRKEWESLFKYNLFSIGKHSLIVRVRMLLSSTVKSSPLINNDCLTYTLESLPIRIFDDMFSLTALLTG